MATDDLNAPLGLGKGKRLPTLPASPPQILAGVLGLSGLVVVGWATFVHDPLGGQPVAVVPTKLLCRPRPNRMAAPINLLRPGLLPIRLTLQKLLRHSLRDRRRSPLSTGPAGPGSRSSSLTTVRTRASHCSIPSCWRQHGTARFRKSDRTVRARRCVTRSRVIFRRIKRMHRLSRSLSAALESAHQARQMHSPRCRRP